MLPGIIARLVHVHKIYIVHVITSTARSQDYSIKIYWTPIIKLLTSIR